MAPMNGFLGMDTQPRKNTPVMDYTVPDEVSEDILPARPPPGSHKRKKPGQAVPIAADGAPSAPAAAAWIEAMPFRYTSTTALSSTHE